MRPSSLALAWAFASIGFSSPVTAQTGAPPPESATELVAPVMIEFVAATLLDDQRPSSTTRVVLDLVVDETGNVGAVTVVESAGALDTHAVEAARRFRFEPARRAGVPVAVTIRYAYVFEPKAAEPVGDPQQRRPRASRRPPTSSEQAAPNLCQRHLQRARRRLCPTKSPSSKARPESRRLCPT